MESCRKVLIQCALLMLICHRIQADTKRIDTNSRSSRQYNYLPPTTTNNNKSANSFFQHTNSYTTKTPRSSDNFNRQPELKIHNFLNAPPDTALFNSYAPPPSGLVSYKNIKLPLEQSDKLPLFVSKSRKSSDYNKHPGFSVDSSSVADRELKNSQTATAVAQMQFRKSIEAASTLTSTILAESNELTANSIPGVAAIETPGNSTDILSVKSPENSVFMPKQLGPEITRSASSEHLQPFHDLLPQGYNINQFIFVINPDKISFFNKLV